MLTAANTITSRCNSRVARIRGLHRRAERERTGLFLAEGIRVVVEAIRQGARIEELVAAPSLLRSEVALSLIAEQKGKGVACLEVSPEVFESLSLRDGPQGAAAVVHQRWETLARAQPGEGLCWLALDAVQDPGNLGCILRTADAVGAAGVILVGVTADPYDPVAVRASTGAVFSQRLVRASLAELGAWKREHGISVIGTSGSARIDYLAAAYQPPMVLFMGSERRGLSEQHLAVCNLVVSIPMVGSSDSLNLSVATAVVLYEAFNQRRAGSRHSISPIEMPEASGNHCPRVLST